MSNEDIYNEDVWCEISDREAEVAEQLLKGNTLAEVGRILFIARATVKAHIQNIKQKLNVKRIEQLQGYFLK